MDKISEKGIKTKKCFLNFIKAFMTNKGIIANNDITLITGKNISSQIGVKFQRHLTNTILTLSKKVAATNLIKKLPH